MPQVEKCTWRRKQGATLGNTLYEGTYFFLDERWVFVSDLSHGIRVLDAQDTLQYSILSRTPVFVTDEYIEEVRIAFRADQRLQERLRAAHHKIMSD